MVALDLFGYFENNHHLAAIHSASEYFLIETYQVFMGKGAGSFPSIHE